MFMNTAVDQQVERYLKANSKWEKAAQQIKLNKLQAPEYKGSLLEGNDGFGLGIICLKIISVNITSPKYLHLS